VSQYQRAQRHAWFMATALGLAIAFVLTVDRFVGHSTLAFGAAIIGLMLANTRMLGFNCPTCGKNMFFRGMVVVPWPNRICGKCGSDLSRPQNR